MRACTLFSFHFFSHRRIRGHNLLTELSTLYDLYWATQLIFAYQFNWHRIHTCDWFCIGIEIHMKIDARKIDQCVARAIESTRVNYQVHAVRLACIKKRLKCNMQ